MLTSPVLRCLKEQLPGVEVHFATKAAYYPLLEANPHVDAIHLLHKNKLHTLIDEIDAQQFDYIIDLHKNLRSFLIRGHLGIASAAVRKQNFRKWMLVHVDHKGKGCTHIVKRYLDAAAKVCDITDDGKGLEYYIPEKDRIDPATLPQAFRSGFTAVVIGAKHNTKMIPQDMLEILCAKVRGPVLLIGGKEDAERGAQTEIKFPGRVYNACGKYTLNESASLIALSHRVIAQDTGMMHIAAALQKEVISVWGNTVPAFGMYPYYGSSRDLAAQKREGCILEVEGLSCRPCSRLGYDRCPRGHFRCMREQSFPLP